MRPDLSPLADILERVTDTDLRALAGERSFTRGHAFAARNRVTRLRMTGEESLAGSVLGNGGIYQVDVEFAADGEVLGGECTCPVGYDCKHVVALVLAARSQVRAAAPSRPGRTSSRPAPRPAAPQWERLLADVLSQDRGPTRYSPLGLLVEVRISRAGGPLGVGLRPVVPGKTGWVRTGVSWAAWTTPGAARRRWTRSRWRPCGACPARVVRRTGTPLAGRTGSTWPPWTRAGSGRCAGAAGPASSC